MHAFLLGGKEPVFQQSQKSLLLGLKLPKNEEELRETRVFLLLWCIFREDWAWQRPATAVSGAPLRYWKVFRLSV